MLTFRSAAVGVALLLLASGLAAAGPISIPISAVASSRPMITTAAAPSVVPAGTYDGVAKVSLAGSFEGSGALLNGGWVLTAAHLLTDSSGTPVAPASSFSVTFNVSGTPVAYTGASYSIYPGWTGDYMMGGDLALIKLSSTPTGITDYDILTGSALGDTVTLLGYGYGGTGAGVSLLAGSLRSGENQFDTYWSDTNGVDFAYAYDFDNGTIALDALGYYGYPGLGLGTLEALIAPGDSGGPSFDSAGNIVGVHSFGTRLCNPNYPDCSVVIDIDGTLNSSYGEAAGDTRLDYAPYAAWLNTTLEESSVPDAASTLLLLGIGLAGLTTFKRWRA